MFPVSKESLNSYETTNFLSTYLIYNNSSFQNFEFRVKSDLLFREILFSTYKLDVKPNPTPVDLNLADVLKHEIFW